MIPSAICPLFEAELEALARTKGLLEHIYKCYDVH